MSKGKTDHREIERRWSERWEEEGTYRYDPTRPRDETFVVDTPPPTVSGSLHVGHVFSYTQTDLMARYKRMRGYNIFYPMGWDDNGLPTERRVQNVFNVRCEPSVPYDPDLDVDWGREGDIIPVSRPNFIELCGRVVEEDEKGFRDTFQRIALSVDWTKNYATVDERSRFVSQLSFLRVLESGEAELREAPTMWDVDYQTAVAQAEVEDREREGAFHRIRFDVEGGEPLVIATTRPELLPACIAVMAHPEDERYKHLIGKTAVTPLFLAPVPIMADENADPEKGTGILMVCTFGDAMDVEWWRQIGGPAREVIGRDGRIKSAAWGENQWQSNDPDSARRYHEKLTGLTVNQARREIVAQLGEADAIDGEPEKTRRFVKFYERGERPLEFVVSRQWFIKVMDKKEALIAQGRKIDWRPELFRKRYEDWVDGLNQDWCVSRQRYFGVPIPVWYRIDEDGEIDHSNPLLPPQERLPIDPSTDVPDGYSEEQRGKPGGFVGDADVFDTWATSALTPLITSGWPQDMDQHNRVYPTDLRAQSHEIIRTWAFVTITRSYLEDGSIPWHNIAISGWILDPDRKKMSKSKGNVVLPTDLLDEFGSDAVRYWAASARLGVDTAFDRNVLKEGRRLVTKLQNAARLIRGYEGEAGTPEHPLDLAFLARTKEALSRATDLWESWDHAGALDAIETWFWSDLCDNYLELSKARAYAAEPSALGTLRLALDIALRAFAPYVPFMTEELYNADRSSFESVHRAAWPTAEEIGDIADDGSFDAAVSVVTQVRKAKSDAKVSLRYPVTRLRIEGPASTLDVLPSVIEDIVKTVNASDHELVPVDGAEEPTVSVELADEPEPPRR